MGFFPRTHAVFGAMRDKDIVGLLPKVAAIVDVWHVCDLATPRAATAEELAAAVRVAAGGRGKEVYAHPGPGEAMRAALGAADPVDRIVVFGSFYTVGGVLKEGLPRLPAPHLGAPA
jgi:dihydrofolate synthase/folylpolyglutamate synthase